MPFGEGLSGSIGPGERQGQQGQEFAEPVGMGQMGVLEVEATGFQGAEQGFNGLITNDKFCLIHTGRLALSWWRRPLRLRDPAAATYLHEVSVPRGGAYEAVMACASIPTGEPGWSAAVGSSLPAPAALGDADRAGGDP